VRTARGSQPAAYVQDVENLPDELARTADQEVLEAERHAALRQAFGALDPFSRQLVSLLIQDPPGSLCRDQRQAGHRDRQHRAIPRPLPGKTAPPSGHCGAD